MICIAQKTLEASPLNSRGCAVPPECQMTGNMHPKGVPHHYAGRPIQGRCYHCHILSAGRTDLRLLRGDAFSVNVLHPSIGGGIL